MKKFLFLSLLGLPVLFLWGCSLINNNDSWINTWDLEKISQLEQQLSWLLEQFSWLQAENESLKETLSWTVNSLKTLQEENEELQADVDKYKKMIVDSKSNNNQTITQNNVSYWFIEWSLSYPSDWIPADMKICAQNTTTQALICTTDHINSNQYTYWIGYKLKVPVGNYYVYAQVQSWNNNYKSYYSDFVICWLKAECPSHNPIQVSVTQNNISTNINPRDWYQ